MKTHSGSLELISVRRTYNDFSLHVGFLVKAGRLLSILGPSGSGKTTTLRMIAGFEAADSGSLVYDGRDITSLHPAERGFGYVPQDLVLFPHLDVIGNVEYGLSIKPKSVKKKVSTDLLKLMDLAGFEKRRVQNLSGGEQQRVALARALAIEPGILLLDEPFSALDTPLRRELRRALLRIKTELGIAIIFVTHDQDEALSISDDLVIMKEGKVVQTGTPEEIFHHPVDSFTASFVGSANLLPVKVIDREKGLLLLEGAGSFQIADFKTAPTDTRGNLLLRPHCLRFCGTGDINSINAEIAEEHFYGDHYEYICKTDRLNLTVVTQEKRRPGERVCVCFDPADGYFLSD